MTLEQKSPGYFIDAALSDSPGTFAVIIGVSAYPHLDDGKGPRAQPTYGLGQLAVSALTGQRFFEWIQRHYEFDEAPLAQCWILASPTALECQAASAVAQYPP